MFRRACVLVCFFVVFFSTSGAQAADAERDKLSRSAVDLLPPSTVLYLEISRPPELVDLAMDHPVHARLREIDEYQRLFQTPQYQQFHVVVKMFEGALEMRWRPGLKLLTQGGLFLAADAQTQGAVVLVKSGDAEKLVAAQDAFLTLVRTEARRIGQHDLVESVEYRGITAYRVGGARFAVVDDWLVLTNNVELGKAILDRYLDADGAPAVATLGQRPEFQAAQAARPPKALAWAYANVAALRESNPSPRLFNGLRNNPLGELLLGGVLDLLADAPYAVAALEADPTHLTLTAATPFDAAQIDETRAYYFGPQGRGAAPPLALVDETLLTLSAYRNLSEFWAAAPDLFEDAIAAKFAEADSNLTTLFSGRDFGDEVLGALEPELQLVVARQTLPQAELPEPNIKLPAFAMVFRLKDEANMRRPLKVSFQSLIGFFNVVGAMQGQPPLELNNETRDGIEIVTSRYLPPSDSEDSARGRIHYNFSPTAVFAGDRLILSSTHALAMKLVEAPPGDAASANLHTQFNTNVLRTMLEENREQFLAQNMLEKGHSREEAEKELGNALELLSWFKNASLRLAHADKLLRLEASLSFAPTPSRDPSPSTSRNGRK